MTALGKAAGRHVAAFLRGGVEIWMAGLGCFEIVKDVLTAASIGASKGGGYARYLEGKTIAPDRSDYYLSRDGEPTQAPGR